ncbi:MFS transporter [Marinicella litoralis]|uniref:1-acyl-sn-glycerol-3-phosphate acyltransferase n=1 Tax=Marinicella litoralis TaxID=644220 RepID=A0A4R6XLB2_9GAMM|nr:MFS transporter [Marinicella litoralis]TDR20392.1 1-acyl-sn-glycerol-3-phosphate acyltransferase [Marinicella litoralis]
MTEKSQFQLLKERRFLPFFLTQFFGAFNDNVFKNALVIMIAFRVADDQVDILTNLAFGLFILPFFLFSAFGGQVADKFEKSVLMRRVKIGEITIMLLASLGFYLNSIPLLIFVLFLMGAQSTLFGPVKYGYLPEKLSNYELMGGNGLVESSTFISILLGTILGGILIAMDSFIPISVAVISFAVMGYLSARAIPLCEAADPTIKLDFNLWRATVKNLKILPEKKVVFLSVLGISWFWFFGSIFLAQMPNFSRTVLGGNEHVVTLLLTMFSVGIGLGSLVCEKLSGRRVEIGLVPIGAIGLAWFGFDLYWVSSQWPDAGLQNLGIAAVMQVSGAYRVCIDLAMIGVFGGLYIVPLYALVQERSDPNIVSRIIAGNNIINAIFMVVAAVLGMVVLGVLDWSIPQLFLITVGLHIVVSLYIFTIVPEFILRLVAWFLVSLVYRVKYKGLEKIPAEGPVVLVCNHVAFVDPAIVMGRVRRPTKFVMHHKIYNKFGMKLLFNAAKTIPIASAKEDPEMMEAAFASVKQALEEGDVVCIFPEGRLTPDGQIGQFKKGIERIMAETPVPVVPMALNNLWGSMFSRHSKNVLKRIPRKFLAKVELIVGDAIPPEKVSADYLRQLVIELKNQAEIANPLSEKQLPDAASKTDSNA